MPVAAQSLRAALPLLQVFSDWSSMAVWQKNGGE
ncbi:MAG: hypothetical protein AW07_00708 [Candidatus Accumulibacter sp. SK-11]|nr:MAG: hypothetical protein AW07_00708 [Candidatus Accumulibacter sp. SK-11]